MRVSYILSHCLRFRHTPDLFLHPIFWPVASRLNNYSKVSAGTNAFALLWAFLPLTLAFTCPVLKLGWRFMVAVAISPRIYVPFNIWDKYVGTYFAGSA